jgi:hypothetical protein
MIVPIVSLIYRFAIWQRCTLLQEKKFFDTITRKDLSPEPPTVAADKIRE